LDLEEIHPALYFLRKNKKREKEKDEITPKGNLVKGITIPKDN
jgi:hypothetical protein